MVAQGFTVDLDKPLVYQVGHLGEAYQEWVHQPIVSKEGPRFFESDFWEFLTRTVWWAIPTIWLPVVCYSISISIRMGRTVPEVALMVAFGIFIWTLMEYTLHRFLFHINTRSYWFFIPVCLNSCFPGCCTIERSELKGCQEKGERFDLDEAVDKNMVLIALLKIFLVVVLVLGTKKLVMGITMSAFLLYFFEYSGESVYRWIMPVAEAQRRISVEIVELEEKDCVFKAPLQQEELSLKSYKSKMKRFFDKKFRRKISNHVKLDCQKSCEKVVDATIVKTDSLARKQQSSASIVLLLVVLVGLIGGRIFALVFTVTWCMMSKQVLLKTVVRKL